MLAYYSNNINYNCNRLALPSSSSSSKTTSKLKLTSKSSSSSLYIINRFYFKTIDLIDKLLKIFFYIIIIFVMNQITPVIYIVEGTIIDTSNMLIGGGDSSVNVGGGGDVGGGAGVNVNNNINIHDDGAFNENDGINIGNIMQEQQQQQHQSDMLFIRHGRSRVRHSNEKDHIRWGLQAFDNLTLDYDIDAFDNDSIIINTGNGNFLFGSDLWALSDNNGSYFNQTPSLIFNNSIQKSRYGGNFQSSGNEYSVGSNEDNKIIHQQSNSIIPTVQLQYSMPTQSPALTTIFPKKKLRKKKIMENIKKNVDKGLEYLKSHKDLDEENIQIPIPVVVVEIKQSPSQFEQQQQQLQQQIQQQQQQQQQKQKLLEQVDEQEQKYILSKHQQLKRKHQQRKEHKSNGNRKNDKNDDEDDSGYQNDSPNSDSNIKNINNNSNMSYNNYNFEQNLQSKIKPTFKESNEEILLSKMDTSSRSSDSNNDKIISTSTAIDTANINDKISHQRIKDIDKNSAVKENNENSQRIIHLNPHHLDTADSNYNIYEDSSLEFEKQEHEQHVNNRKHSHKQLNTSPSSHNNNNNNENKNKNSNNNNKNNNNKNDSKQQSFKPDEKEIHQGYKRNEKQEEKEQQEEEEEEKNVSSSFNSNNNEEITKISNKLDSQQYQKQQQQDKEELQQELYENKFNIKEIVKKHKPLENYTREAVHLNTNDNLNSNEKSATNLTTIITKTITRKSDDKKIITESLKNSNVKSFQKNQLKSSDKLNTNVAASNINVNENDKNDDDIDDNDDNNNKNENINVVNMEKNDNYKNDLGIRKQKKQKKILEQKNHVTITNNDENHQKIPFSNQNINKNHNYNVASNMYSNIDDISDINYKIDNINEETNLNNKMKENLKIRNLQKNNNNNENNENIEYEQQHENNKDDDILYDTIMNDETFIGDENNGIIDTDQDTILLDDDINGGGGGGGGIGSSIGGGGTSEDTDIELNVELDKDTSKYPGTVKPEDDDYDDISRKNRLNLVKGRDVVTKFLQIVETQHLLGANCKAGTALNLGEGVVDRYAQDRFRVEAEVAVNRANMLTRIFKNTSPEVVSSEQLLHASVLSMVAFDDDIFAAGHCFDWDQHPSKSGLFCPFAYRLPPPDQGALLAKDLAVEYHYLGNTSEWFFQARKNAENVIARNDQYIKAFHLYSNSTNREEDEVLAVKYEDGRWSKPYYDCGGGNIWMLTYTVPFFGYDPENSTYFFKGTSGIDIDLRRVDIDQCPQRYVPGTTTPLNIFAGTDKCKQRTTMCLPIPGLGFRRGSYKCICRKGFYFPDTTTIQKYFNGSVLEEEYEKLMLGDNSSYSKVFTYECLPCAEGCDYCEDASPCVAALNWPMRTSILVLACAVIGFLPPAAWFTFRYQQVKVVRAASPALLRVIALGAFFIYCTTIVMYPHPSLYTCTARVWLREIGFSLTYGALMLKTWRISVIFRVRSAKAVKITDAALLKRLGVICAVIGACLLVRTIVSPPEVVVGRTADDLKAFLCKTDWWDYTFTSMEVLFLAWGVRLCIMVRKAPSEFNESRFISMAIYNEFLLTCFLNVSMLFLQSPANPDLLFIIFFCHTQLTVTLLLGLIFGSKVYIVLRSGKSQEAIAMGAKSSGAKFNFRPQIRTFANPSTSTSTAQMHTADTKLSDQEALEEIRQLSYQLQRIQESAPPKGIAVMTISSLLDSLRTTSQQLSLVNKSSTGAGSSGNASGPVNNIGSLPIFAVNDLQKYVQNNNTAITTVNSQKQVTILEQSATKTTPTTTTIKGSSALAVVEKSINTSLTGDEFLNKIKNYDVNHDNDQHQTICSSCAKIISNVSSCNQIDSPTSNKNILSFSNLKLECMCSQSIDDFNERQTISISNKQSPIKNNNLKSLDQNHYQYYQLYSLPQQTNIDGKIDSATLNIRSSSSLKLQKYQHQTPTYSSNSLIQLPQFKQQHNNSNQSNGKHHQQQQQQNLSISSINNYTNLKTSKTIDEISISLSSVAQKLEAHSLKLENNNNNKGNSNCDNQNKLIKKILICDNCKNILINLNNEKYLCNSIDCSKYNRIINKSLSNNSINNDSNNKNNKIKTKSKNLKENNSNLSLNLLSSNHHKSNIELNIIDSNNTIIQQQQQQQQQLNKYKLNKTFHNDDDISFHSTDDSSCYGDDCTADGGISEGSILASTHYNLTTQNNVGRITNIGAVTTTGDGSNSSFGEGRSGIGDSCSPLLLRNRKTPKIGVTATTTTITTGDTNYDDNDSVQNLNLYDESIKSATGSYNSGNEENIITESSGGNTSQSDSVHSKDNNTIQKPRKTQQEEGGADDGGEGVDSGDNNGGCGVANSNNSSIKKRKNKNDKLVLDLNDRTKYTKEVSV